MFQYITDKIRGRRKRLLHDYIAIFIIMGMVLLLSFLIIGYIANSTTMEQSRNSSRVIYKQAREAAGAGRRGSSEHVHECGKK